MAEANIPRSARLTKANRDTYVKKVLDDMLWHKSALMAALRSRGKIKTNKGGQGHAITWRPAYRYPVSEVGSANPTSITFQRKNFWKEATLPWRHRRNGISNTAFENIVNRGSARFYNLQQEDLKLATKGFVDDIKRDLYTDGNANTNNLMGLCSWTGNTGSVTTNTPVLNPNDTYAGLATALGQYDGGWSSTDPAWPMGYENAGGGYCFWSPMGIDVASSYWGGSSLDTWFENWQRILNFSSTFMEALHDDRIDMYLITPTYMNDLRNSLISLQTLEVTQDSALVKLGHETLRYMGKEIASESYVHAAEDVKGFGLCFEHLELWAATKNLVETKRDEDITTLEELTALYSFLQLITWTPGCQVYFEEATTPGTHT